MQTAFQSRNACENNISLKKLLSNLLAVSCRYFTKSSLVYSKL